MQTPFTAFPLTAESSTVEFTKLCSQLQHLSPPELQLTPESQVLRRFVEDYGFSNVSIAIFNHWIEKILPEQITNQKVRIDTSTHKGHVEFSEVKVLKPRFKTSDGHVVLTPRICQERGYPYSGEVRAKAKFVSDAQTLTLRKELEAEELLLFQIPIMLGSKRCWLYDNERDAKVSDDEKIAMGECPNDPLGYFIIGGTPKVITIQEKLRIFLYLSFLDTDGNLETRMTCPSTTGTTITSIAIDKKRQSLKVGLQHLKRTGYMPIYFVHLISKYDIEKMARALSRGAETQKAEIKQVYSEFTDLILKFCKPEEKAQVLMALQSSIAEASNSAEFQQIIDHISAIRELKAETLLERYTKIRGDIISDLFSHVPIPLKERNLALMAANTVRYLLGYRPADDRDSWANKRLDTPARSMEQLFNSIWQKIITDDKKFGSKMAISITPAGKVHFAGKPAEENFISAFQPGGWGVNKGHNRSYSKENITDTLKRDTPMAIYSQVGRINTPSSRQAKQTSIRMIQPTQLGICCPVESPEGDGLGLLKNLGLTTIVSMERKPTQGMYQILGGFLLLDAENPSLADNIARVPEPDAGSTLFSLVEEMYRRQQTWRTRPAFTSHISTQPETDWIPVSIAGVIYFWTIPPGDNAPKDILGRGLSYLEQIFLYYRRAGLLPYDSCIFYNPMDNILEYFCEGGRPCRPLFIVSENKLLIDHQPAGFDLASASTTELLQRGCVEFVDAREQEYTMLAMYPQDVRSRITRLQQLEAMKPSLEVMAGAAMTASLAALETYKDMKMQLGAQLGKPLFAFFAAVEEAKKGPGGFDVAAFRAGLFRAITAFYRKLVALVSEAVFEGVSPNFDRILELASSDSHRYVLDAIDSYKVKYTIDAGKLPKVDRLDDQSIAVMRDFELELNVGSLITTVQTQLLTELATLQQRVPYTHSEIDPVAIFGVAGSLEPQPNCGQGPRATYQAAMCKQALGFYHYNHHLRFDTGFKVMTNPSRPLFETIVAEPAGLNSAPTGTTAICAFLAMTDNNEDAIYVKKEFVEQSNLDIVKYTTYKTVRSAKSKPSGTNKSYNEIFTKPVAKPSETDGRYAALDDRGLPRLDALIRQGDAIIGKIRRQANGPDINVSVFAGVGGGGYVDRVFVTWNLNNESLVKVKLRQTRKHVSGDKVASRYAQKGTFSRILPARELPMILGGKNHGLVPDLFLNPHSISSRMTTNKLKEMKSSIGAVYIGKRVDATCFHPFDFAGWSETLKSLGMNEHGDVDMIRPDGKVLKSVFVGPCYYQCLRHHVRDKFQMRSRGAIKFLTQQPVGGREYQGGLRVGEMERDGLISHAASSLVLERLMRVSDAYKAPFCRVCGNLAIVDVEAKKFICRVCEGGTQPRTLTLATLKDSSPASLVARDQFVVKEIPYVLKLMFNMLQALGFNVTLKFRRLDTQIAKDPTLMKYLQALA